MYARVPTQRLACRSVGLAPTKITHLRGLSMGKSLQPTLQISCTTPKTTPFTVVVTGGRQFNPFALLYCYSCRLGLTPYRLYLHCSQVLGDLQYRCAPAPHLSPFFTSYAKSTVRECRSTSPLLLDYTCSSTYSLPHSHYPLLIQDMFLNRPFKLY